MPQPGLGGPIAVLRQIGERHAVVGQHDVDRIKEHGHDLTQEGRSVHLGGCVQERDVSEIAHSIDCQGQVEPAFCQAQLAMVNVDVGDRCLGKLRTLGRALTVFGQPKDAVPDKAARESLGMLSRKQPRTTSSGSRVQRRNSTKMASSASVRVVLRGRFGTMG